jgi:hypothetical protein
MAVPATISGHTGAPVWTNIKSMYKASTAFTAYKYNSIIRRFGLKIAPMPISADTNNILNTIFENGWAEAHFDHEAAQALQDKLGQVIDSTMYKAMWMFSKVEQVNRAVTILTAYNTIAAHGIKTPDGIFIPKTDLTTGQMLEFAKHISDRAHGIYGKAAKPYLVQRYRFLDAPYTFQKFQHSYMLNMLELTSKYNASKATAFMAIVPQILAGTSLAATLLFKVASLFGVDDPEDSYVDTLSKFLGDSTFAKDFSRNGIIGSIFGLNFKGALDTKSPFPANAKELFGAPEAVITDIVDSYKALHRGEYSKFFETALPAFLAAPIKAYREQTEGVTKTNYAPLFDHSIPLKPDGLDFVKRLLSFNPVNIPSIRERQWNEEQVRKHYQETRTDIAAVFNRLIVQRAQKDEWDNFYAKVADYNNKVSATNPKFMIPYITVDWLFEESHKNFTPTKYTK